MSSQIGPYRVMPAKVRAGLEYLSYCVSVDHGCGDHRLARDLDKAETRCKVAVLGMLQQWFMGETELADVMYYAHPIPSEAMTGDVLEIQGGDDADPIDVDDDD